MPDNPNIDLASQAAEAVNPNGQTQQQIIDRATYVQPLSYADKLMGKTGDSSDTENSFLSGLEKANTAKEALEHGVEAPSQQANGQPQAQAPRKLTDPPVAPKQRSNFRKLEAERDALRTRLKELEGSSASPATNGASQAGVVDNVPNPSSSPYTPEQFKALNDELDNLRGELAAVDITRDPAFKAKFEQPRAITIKQAKNISGAKGAEVEAALSMPPGSLRDQKLEELLAELPASTAAIVKAANNKLAELSFYEQIEAESARSSATDRLKQRSTQQAQERLRQKAEFDLLVQEWAKGGVESLDPTKDKAATSIIQQAEAFYEGKLNNKDRAAMSLQAALVPGLLAEVGELNEEVERLTKQLGRYSNGLPGDGDAHQDQDEPHRPQTGEQRDKDFLGGLNRAIKADPTFAAVRRHRGLY